MQNGMTNPQPSTQPTPAPTAPTGAPQGMLAKMQLSPWLLRKLLMLAILVGVGIGSFCWGRREHATAKNPVDPDGTGSSDNAKRVVAYLYGDKPVSREELGEYLIARFGSERMEFMLNRKIVDIECRKQNIIATDSEVEHRFRQDLKSFGTDMTEKEFVNSILRRFGKTLYEWKEDVIRPKLMMEKLVRSTIKITDADVKEGYDTRYGPKVECRMIVCEKGNHKHALKVWENARKGTAYFLEEARKQFIPNLASQEGRVPAIHKHFGDKKIEECAFRLKESEIGPLMEMVDGTYVILMCEKHLPGNIAVRYEDVRAELSKEMFELRVAQRIPEVFAEMRKRAAPRVMLDNTGTPSSNVSIQGPDPMPLAPQVKPVDIPPPPVPQEVKPPMGVKPLPEPPVPMTLTIPPPPMATGTPMPVAPLPMPVVPPPAKK